VQTVHVSHFGSAPHGSDHITADRPDGFINKIPERSLFMKKIWILIFLLVPLLLAGCGNDKYGAGADSAAQKVKVKDLFLQQSLLGQKVTVEGKVGSQCQSNGCWFFLQDDTGQVYIDLSTNQFSLPAMPGKTVVASGTVAMSKQNILLVATGVEVK